MSTISVAQKSKTLSILDNRNVSLIILAALVTLLIAVVAVSAAAPETRAFDPHGYQVYRQSEWASVPVPAVDLSAYLQSERTLVDPNAGMAIYQHSERTLTDPQAGMAIYQHSERTRIPVPFTKYQLSEWFGK